MLHSLHHGWNKYLCIKCHFYCTILELIMYDAWRRNVLRDEGVLN